VTDERPTVTSLLSDQHVVARRIAALVKQRSIIEQLYGPPPPSTRRTRLAARIRHAREVLALRLAPWLERP
jgi:hypothetical protein